MSSNDDYDEEDVSPDSLKRVAQLSALMLQQQEAVEDATRVLREKQTALNKTRLEDLPELMHECGITQLKLEDGSVVDLKEEVSASISAERFPQAVAWLTERGYDGIVKCVLQMSFGRGERDAAVDLAAKIAGISDHNVTIDENIHASTLKAFVKERLAAGEQIPFDLFSIHPYTEARIKAPRAASKRT